MKQSREFETFLDTFGQLEDPRVERSKLYPMNEVLLVSVCGIAAGCDGWNDIELFGKQRLDFLRQYLPFEHGIPSDDTLRRFFRAVDLQRFEQLFMQWIGQWHTFSTGATPHIAIDGKTLRDSVDGAHKALHLVSAYASETRLVLGQLKVNDKSNEITAIPMLLNALDLRGATLTLDAMGCQYKIADQIIASGGDYIFGLKGNQGTLHDDVMTWFQEPPKHANLEILEHCDKGHGRLEMRKIIVTGDVDWLHQRHPQWKSIRCIICVEATRQVGQKISTERRYYISSNGNAAEKLLLMIRAHWGIENSLHWVLDMSFGEDQSRIRKGNAPGNIAVIRHAVLNAIRLTKPKHLSIKQMRKLAGWDNCTMAKILQAIV
uniref:Predicted transposase YbfD/YdcC associated with H repeats n=1 Tax=Candidatus Kentrum sp. FW TaxID=2126338 RepID=A0A450SIQ7_9GAMM|nr:MAG: Predicted transposase YbfD/YdcC associated with H repeats [Candidatus Kentron sp. FW]